MKARYLRHIMDLSPSAQQEQERQDERQESMNDDSDKKSQRSKKRKEQTRSLPPRIVKADTLETPPPPLDEDDDVSSGSAETPSTTTVTTTTTRKRRSPYRYFVYALVLWLLEFGTVLLLKRLGIQFEFNEQVVQNVLEQQFGRFNETLPVTALSYLTQEKKRPGFQLAADGAAHHFPVVLVHGFVTSGLEVWAGQECARQHFRQRFWAAMYGARSFLQDRDCWKEHMQLDPLTGMDPPGIRLRAATGFEAVDYFMANYWVFGKIIENMADLGYSPSDMVVEAYDWRLGFQALEERDGYFTTLKHRIEGLHKTQGRKVVLTSHSMGVLVIHHFFAWVTTDEKDGGGGGGYDWVDQHVHAYVNIAGSHLGVPKAATSILSGDLSDFIQTISPVARALENFFGRKIRREMWSTWGSIWMMLPKGPASIWDTGADMCHNRTSDEESDDSDVFCPSDASKPSPMLAMSDVHNQTVQGAVEADDEDGQFSALEGNFVSQQTHTTVETIDYLKAYGGGYGDKFANAVKYSYHENDGDDQEPSPRTWHDPTRTPLPYAPNLKIYCLYGVGIETERAYYYRRNVVNNGNKSVLEQPSVILDHTVNQPDHDVQTGVRYTDGDGSVPLVSLGYICADAWQRKDSGLNPSGTTVYTREYRHRSEFVVDDPVRGGPSSADHVDVLGNKDMMTDLARIVSNFEVEKVNENHIVSDIERIAAEINARGGICENKQSKKKKKKKRRRLFNFLP